MLGDMIPLKLGAGVLLKHKDLSVIMGYSKMILAHHLKAQCIWLVMEALDAQCLLQIHFIEW